MKCKMIFALAMLCALPDAFTQNEKVVIGKPFPDFVLPTNSPGGSLKVSDYRGKVLILDFWATWCGSCIAKMPELHRLQAKYGDRIQVVLVNAAEKRSTVEKFIARRQSIPRSRMTLPIAFADSAVLKKLEIRSMPEYFWIDSTSTLRYRPNSNEINDANVESFLFSKRILSLAELRQLSRDTIGGRRNLLWKSELISGPAGDHTHLDFDETGGSNAACENSSILDLYRFAFGRFQGGRVRSRSWVEPVPFNRTIFKSGTGEKIGRHYGHNDPSDATYSYRISGPDNTSWRDLSEVMKGELENWFGYTGHVEKMKVKYYSLTVPDSSVFNHVSGDIKSIITDTELVLENISVALFLKNLVTAMNLSNRFSLSEYPIVYESTYRGPIGGVNLHDINTADPSSLQESLKSTGIRLRLVEGELEMLVIEKRTAHQQ